MKMVLGIVRPVSLDRVINDLKKIEIVNLTVAEVKGIGEETTLYTTYAIHKAVLLIVPDDKVDQVTNVIAKSAGLGSAGDGIITVLPVDYMLKIRTMERFE